MWKAPSQFHFLQRCILPRALVSITAVIIVVPLAFVPLQLRMETAMTLIILIMLWN